MSTLLLFRAGNEQWEIPTDDVDRIIETGGISPVAFMAPWMLGMTYSRGELLEVVDLAGLLKKENCQLGINSRMLVIRNGTAKMAVVVDEVFGFVDSDEDSGLRRPGNGTAIKNRTFSVKVFWNQIQNGSHG